MTVNDDAEYREQKAYSEVDEALRTYPLFPAPATIYTSTMARIRETQCVPRFSLGWLDYALSLLVTIAAGLAILFFRTLPSGMVETIKIELLLSVQRMDPWLLSPVTVGSLVFVVLATALVAAFLNSQDSDPVDVRR